MEVKVGESVKQVHESRKFLQKCCRDASLREVLSQNYHTRTGPTKPQNTWWSLSASPTPSPQPQKMVSLLHSHPSIQK